MRTKVFLSKNYFLKDNPFPHDPIVRWGEEDARSNGSLYSREVLKDAYNEAVNKFVVNPVDSGSKFHFLWSLGSGDEARGFGKTAMLHNIARSVNRDLGYDLLTTHEFDEEEARDTPILATMATFNQQKVTTLSAISLEHVKYLLQEHDDGVLPLRNVRAHLVERLSHDPQTPFDRGDAEDPRLREAIERAVSDEDMKVKGQTIAAVDKRFLSHFANDDFRQLRELVNAATARTGYDYLHTTFVIARAAGIRRIFLLIDEVEAFANADVPRKRRQMEVERFRDLAIETQPFGEMASYILTMHPDAARTIEEFWSLARLPKIDYQSKQNSRVTVVLRELKKREEVEELLVTYLKEYRTVPPPDDLFPFAHDATDALLEISRGRPGKILEGANRLITEGATSHWERITAQEVKDYLAQEGRGEAVERRRRIGAIDT